MDWRAGAWGILVAGAVSHTPSSDLGSQATQTEHALTLQKEVQVLLA